MKWYIVLPSIINPLGPLEENVNPASKGPVPALLFSSNGYSKTLTNCSNIVVNAAISSS